jgi:hypothetical protein
MVSSDFGIGRLFILSMSMNSTWVDRGVNPAVFIFCSFGCENLHYMKRECTSPQNTETHHPGYTDICTYQGIILPLPLLLAPKLIGPELKLKLGD